MLKSDTDLLAITKPEKLFSNEDTVKDEYRTLSLAWHPDKNPTANSDVFPHVTTLYKAALQKIEDGSWGFAGTLLETSKDNKKYKFNYHSKHIIEIGEMYVGNTIVTFKIPLEHKEFVDNATKVCNSMKYASTKMEDQFKPVMPNHKFTVETDTHYIIVYTKSEDVLCLQDILNHYNNYIDPVHVAWIMSRMYNINCFLSYNHISHTNLSPTTIFINPAAHTTCIIGGWWYATPYTEKITALTATTYNLVPKSMYHHGTATNQIDSECVKILGRQLLGDIHGSRLTSNAAIPAPLLNWIRTPCGTSAIGEYHTWMEETLIKSFGPRKFVEFPVNKNNVYN